MDANPDVLADTIRAKRAAIDQDLKQLRGKLASVDPRRRIDARQLAKRALPVVAGTAALWLWRTRRRRVRSLGQLLNHGLLDLYRTETQLVPVLDRMSKQAWNDDLAHAFTQHRVETEGHIDRLHRIFRAIGTKPARGSSAAVEALVAEGQRLMARHMDRDVRDAWLIATAQRVEHLEIANYGTVRTYAELLGFTYAAQLLQQTLDEERAADARLTQLAERFVNPQSLHESPAL
ncbi:MAG TPA: ferritin-like domain-containing protein [Vicinamibacterales bacterium]|nr:ferritin-like domain-containing protein [Vicinamibacterales bacterium]